MSMKENRRMGAVALWVADLEKSAAFYRDVIGIPLEYSDAHDPENVPHYEIMWGDWGDHGPVEPFLWFNLYASPDRKTSGAHVSIRVPDIERVHANARQSGMNVLTPPTDSPFGGRRAVIEDPDGNLVEISDG